MTTKYIRRYFIDLKNGIKISLNQEPNMHAKKLADECLKSMNIGQSFWVDT